jgi:hypothetical protein
MKFPARGFVISNNALFKMHMILLICQLITMTGLKGKPINVCLGYNDFAALQHLNYV